MRTDYMIEMVVPQAVEPLLIRHCAQQLHDPSQGVPGASKMTAKFNHTMYLTDKLKGIAHFYIRKTGWRPRIGGVEFTLLREGKVERALALYKDAEWSETILKQDMTRARGVLIFQLVQGKWYAYIRYRDIGDRAKSGRTTRNRQAAAKFRKALEAGGVSAVLDEDDGTTGSDGDKPGHLGRWLEPRRLRTEGTTSIHWTEREAAQGVVQETADTR